MSSLQKWQLSEVTKVLTNPRVVNRFTTVEVIFFILLIYKSIKKKKKKGKKHECLTVLQMSLGNMTSP